MNPLTGLLEIDDQDVEDLDDSIKPKNRGGTDRGGKYRNYFKVKVSFNLKSRAEWLTNFFT